MASINTMVIQEPTPISEDWNEVDIDEFDAVSINIKPESKEKYPAKLHARSVARELGVKDGLIYLPGLPARSFEDSDQPAFFRQRRYFYYLSGIDFANCVITYDIRHDLLYAWIAPPNSGSNVIFNGFNPTRQEVESEYDVDSVSYLSNLNSYVTYFAQHIPGKIYALHNYQLPKNVVNGTSKKYDTERLVPAMDAARALKSPYEIKMIRKASAITARAHLNVLRSIKRVKNEADVEAIFTATCISEQAKNQAYGIIAGSGPNASTLHYIANNEPLKGRQLLCLDAGCEWQCYASDVTRTFPISGKFTTEAKAIYDLVAKMQEECIAMVRPGENYRQIHMHAHKVATKGLIELGLLKGEFEELYAAGASVAFFPHGLGHYLGLECHDVGKSGYLLYGFSGKPRDWQDAFSEMLKNLYAPSASVLYPNMVITVEPGIYFSRYALEEVYLKNERYAKYINKDLLEKYYPVGGVRIEDDILVTEDGYENLTTAPKGDEALKIINADDEKKEDSCKKGWI